MKFALSCCLVMLAACASTSANRSTSGLSNLPLNTCEGIQAFFRKDLNAYQDEVDEASKNYQQEQWKVETADSSGSQEKMSQLFQILQDKSYNKAILEQTLNLYQAAAQVDAKTCPWKGKLARVKTLLETTILTKEEIVKKEKENQDLQDALQTKSNAFRIEVPGEPEPVSKALLGKKIRSTDDRSVRESLYKQFNSSRSKKWIEWGFKDLVASRNAEAKLAGFKNYYEYKYFRGQLDLKNYLANVKQLKSRLAPKMKKVLKEMGNKFGIKKVEAWDVSYLREKSASGEINQLLKDLPETEVMAVAKAFYSALGIDVDSYGFTMDLYPRPGKNTHAFAMGVVPPHVNDKGEVLPDPKPDIRFLANLKKPVQWDDISTVIHELGHAIHYGEIRQPLGIFRGFGSVETEAIAMNLERMAESSEFLGDVLPKVTGTSPEVLHPIFVKMVKATKVEQAFTLMRQVFFSEFEHQIYANPGVDYSKLWSRMYKQYWGVDVNPEYTDWDIDHFTMAPVYVQNYAIGIIMVEQIYASILKDFNTSYHSKVLGDKLKQKYFGPGMEYNYLTLTENFTGAPLTANAALKLLD